MHHNTKNWTGQNVGDCLVLSYVGPSVKGGRKLGTQWKLRCHCGTEFTAWTTYMCHSNWTGKRFSCGCLGGGRATITHGHAAEGKQSQTYRSWKSMLTRVRNSNQERWIQYGGRGITVAKRWEKFENFLADMGEAPGPRYSIGRKNNDKNYEPSNCRWETDSEQAVNKSNSIWLRVNGGKPMPLREAAKQLNRTYHSAYKAWMKAGRPENWITL